MVEVERLMKTWLCYLLFITIGVFVCMSSDLLLLILVVYYFQEYGHLITSLISFMHYYLDCPFVTLALAVHSLVRICCTFLLSFAICFLAAKKCPLCVYFYYSFLVLL